jgi:CheY-like chemotaxis protein
MNEPLPAAVTDDDGMGTLFAVDDDENDRLLLARVLRESGLPCRCRFFSSGDELLDALIAVLRGSPPPLACFVDIKMSGMSGLDVLRWIRAQHGLDEVPVIMLSSSDAAEFLAEAHQFGAQCYTTKFPTPEHLSAIVEAARRYCANARCHSAFSLPCNLLLGAPAVPSHSATVSNAAPFR